MAGPPYSYGVLVDIRRATSTVDEYGNSVPGGFATVAQAVGCGIAPRKDLELLSNGRQGVIVGWTVYAPNGTDVQAHDRVAYGGVEYEVEGEPGVWVNPMSGWYAGVEINIKRVEG